MERVVYVQDKDGRPLDPTKRFGWVRRALRDGKAVKAESKPFTVRLTYEPETHVVHGVTLGIKAGRTDIGLSCVDGDGVCKYAAECETRNKDIPGLMRERKMHRQASRRGERRRRQRRAVRNSTVHQLRFRRTGMGMRPDTGISGAFSRTLPGCRKPVHLKGIINTEARFNNRKREPGWLTPTANQLLETIGHLIEQAQKILPVTSVIIEADKYSFMELEAGGKLPAWKYREGPMHGKKTQIEVLSELQGGKCLLCGKKPLTQKHHIVPASRNGSDRISNLAAVCGECHEKLHKDPEAADKLAKKKQGDNKKYGALSVINQITPKLAESLSAMFPDAVYTAAGYDVKAFRDEHGLAKSAVNDAYCLACMTLENPGGIHEPAGAFHIKQYRRHDRQIVKAQRGRYYYLDGKKVAVNRRKAAVADPRTGKDKKQPMDSLDEWYGNMVQSHGEKEAEKMRSRLAVRKSTRSYNNRGRAMPGAVFEYEGNYYVMDGQLTNGKYYRAYGSGKKNFPAAKCRIVRQNNGLVYVS